VVLVDCAIITQPRCCPLCIAKPPHNWLPPLVTTLETAANLVGFVLRFVNTALAWRRYLRDGDLSKLLGISSVWPECFCTFSKKRIDSNFSRKVIST